jgi:hypothetical protein
MYFKDSQSLPSALPDAVLRKTALQFGIIVYSVYTFVTSRLFYFSPAFAMIYGRLYSSHERENTTTLEPTSI